MRRRQKRSFRVSRTSAAVALFGLAASSLIWLVSPRQPGIGTIVPDALRFTFGVFAPLPALLALMAASLLFVGYSPKQLLRPVIGSTVLLFVLLCARQMLIGLPGPSVAVTPGSSGGYLGTIASGLLVGLLGNLVAGIALAGAALIGSMLVLELRPRRTEQATPRRTSARAVVRASGSVGGKGIPPVTEEPGTGNLVPRGTGVPPVKEGARGTDVPPVKERSAAVAAFMEARAAATPEPAVQDQAASTPPSRKSPRSPRRGAEAPEQTSFATFAIEAAPDAAGYTLPPLDMLARAPKPDLREADAEMARRIQVLEQTLQEFGIEATVVEIGRGPTVTRYEVQLAPGIKVGKIVSLADNLAMSLAAIDVRVEAPIPGKSAIGVEVPNTASSVVALRDCLDRPDFWNAPSKLTFALGQDVSGEYRYADLARMPHLLVGGSTNSGKSVCLNVIIASIVYRASPREVRFVLIDPKRVELSLWDGIPHLMHPVVKDVKQASGIFRATLKEMDRRYDEFAKLGTRNLEGFNQRVPEDERLPYIVVIVDELADLIMQQGAEVEGSICRLAQLARATGIHLVVATQRPSVNIITGTIKANIASRLAFAVSSQIDSRTILDTGGAERLIGRGDLLYLPIDAPKPTRMQGCYLSEGETNRLVAYLKKQERPSYSMVPLAAASGEPEGRGGGEGEDQLFENAVKLIVSNGSGSTSMLQRRFKIGYTRAARILDQMEERGVVGPLDGAKPREVLISRTEADAMFVREG